MHWDATEPALPFAPQPQQVEVLGEPLAGEEKLCLTSLQKVFVFFQSLGHSWESTEHVNVTHHACVGGKNLVQPSYSNRTSCAAVPEDAGSQEKNLTAYETRIKWLKWDGP